MKFINKNISIMKQHPISVTILLLIAISTLGVSFYHKSISGIFISIMELMFYYFMFYASHNEEQLLKELNEVVKEKGLSKDQVRALTGLNRYELTSGESYELLFNVSSSKRKVILEQLKGYDAHAS